MGYKNNKRKCGNNFQRQQREGPGGLVNDTKLATKTGECNESTEGTTMRIILGTDNS